MFNYKNGNLIKYYCNGLCAQCVNLHANSCVLTELHVIVTTIRLITGCTFLLFIFGYVK